MPTREEKEQLAELINAKIDDIVQLLEFARDTKDKEVCMYHLWQFKTYANIVVDNID